MRGIILAAVFVFLVISSLIFFIRDKKISKVCFKNNCFEVELAVSSEEKKQGLMFREKIDNNEGMLFLFDKEGAYSFWMKNVKFPLDIIWIGENKKVVFISKNTPVCEDENCDSVKPDKKAKYVLELNAGIADQIGLKLGDKAEIF